MLTREWLRAENRNLRLQAFDSNEREWNGPFTFVQAADTQLGFMEDPSWGGNGNGSWDDEVANAERLVRCVNALRPPPRFVVVCGDLVHSLPAGLTKSADGGLPSADRYTNHIYWKRQTADFKRVMRRLHPHIPLVCVCGNHDVGDRPTPTSLSQYRSEFGDDYFSFWCGGVRCFVLNSQLFGDSRDAPDAQNAQEAWLAENLKDMATNKPKHTIVFQHIPWFLREASEPKEGYFNLDVHLREKWLPLMQRGGVSKVFCGHYHRNAGGFVPGGDLEVIVTSAVGRQMSAAEVAANRDLGDASDLRSGMRIVSVREDRIDHEYHEFADLELNLGLVLTSSAEQRVSFSLDKRCHGRTDTGDPLINKAKL